MVDRSLVPSLEPSPCLLCVWRVLPQQRLHLLSRDLHSPFSVPLEDRPYGAAQSPNPRVNSRLPCSYVTTIGIPVTVAPVEVNDSVPTEDEIEDAVKKLRRNRSGGESGMQAEYLKGWLAASNRVKQAVDKGEENHPWERTSRSPWHRWRSMTRYLRRTR